MPLTSRAHRLASRTAANEEEGGGLLMPSLGVKKTSTGKNASGRRERSFFGRGSPAKKERKTDFTPLKEESKGSSKASAKQSKDSSKSKSPRTSHKTQRTPLSPARSLRTVTTTESSLYGNSPTDSSHATDESAPQAHTQSSSSGTTTNPLSPTETGESLNRNSVKGKVSQWEERRLGSDNDSRGTTGDHEENDHPEDEDEDNTSVFSVTSISSNFAETVLKLVEDCESRWNAYTESFMGKPKAIPAPPTSITSSHEDDNKNNPTLSTPHALVPHVASMESVASQIILRQQAEIEYLRAKVEKQEQLLQERTLALPAPPPVEEIDMVPMEEVEVILDDNDVVSVSSYITHLNDVKSVSEETAALAYVPVNRPDVDQEDDEIMCKKQVQDYPLQLCAANGSVRNALYTGPFKRGNCTGVGVLRFETDDVYMGEVVNGKVSAHLRQNGAGDWQTSRQKRLTRL